MVALFIGCALVTQAGESGADFARDVRPVLERHCFKCHGPEKQKGELRFDVKEGAFKTGESGERPIVPKHASESRLIKLVTSAKEDEWMPPKGERLAVAEIDLLKRWIDAGAEWPEASSAGKSVARAEMVVTEEDRGYGLFGR